MTNFYLIIFLLFFPITVFAGYFTDETYDECLLDNIKNTEKHFIIEIKKACARLHPTTVPINEAKLILYALKSGVLFKEKYYKTIYDEYYSDIPYDDFLLLLHNKFYSDVKNKNSYSEFLEFIRS